MKKTFINWRRWVLCSYRKEAAACSAVSGSVGHEKERRSFKLCIKIYCNGIAHFLQRTSAQLGWFGVCLCVCVCECFSEDLSLYWKSKLQVHAKENQSYVRCVDCGTKKTNRFGVTKINHNYRNRSFIQNNHSNPLN